MKAALAMSGSLTVTVRSAANLPNLERFGKSDPLCVVTFQGKNNTNRLGAFIPKVAVLWHEATSRLVIEKKRVDAARACALS